MRGTHSKWCCGSLSCMSWLTSWIFMSGSCGLYAKLTWALYIRKLNIHLHFFFFFCLLVLFFLKKEEKPEWCFYKNCFFFFLILTWLKFYYYLLHIRTLLLFLLLHNFFFLFFICSSCLQRIFIKSNLIYWTTFPNSNLVFQ